jgi:hypothetical protein
MSTMKMKEGTQIYDNHIYSVLVLQGIFRDGIGWSVNRS